MYYVIASGKKKSKIGSTAIEEVCKKLEERRVSFELMVSAYKGHTIELAKEASQKDDCEAIIAVGGDGTFYEVLNGMDTKKIPIGFIPAGTGNDFARCLGIGIDINQCLDNIIGKEPVYLDYLKIGDYKSFNVVGSGFDILLLSKEDELRQTGKYSDRRSYQAALMSTILHCKFENLRFRVDDGQWQSQEIFMMDCCNGMWGAGMMPLCLEADPEDGLMDFVLIKKFSKFKLLPLLLKYQKGLLPKTKYYMHFSCRKVELEIEPKLKANLDGELIDLFPITVELIHHELKYFKSLIPPKDPYELLKNKKAV